jgi:NADH:ubiquinone reductase (H+-translocating)
LGKAHRATVVIIGAGFGGLSAARALRRATVDVVLVDQNNYHLFTPLLYEVGTALLDSSEIAYPVRGIFHRVPNVDFRKGRVRQIDLDGRQVRTAEGALRYDYLVVSAGSVNNFFGNHSAERNSFALKDMGEALALRNHILARFEEATWTQDAARRRLLMSFVVVGGGPTGVEFAGALSELIHLVLRKDFPRLRLDEVEIRMVEAVDHILGAFETRLQDWAVARLQRMGIQVILGSPVEEIGLEEVRLKDGTLLPAATVVWTAGVKASALGAQLGVELGRGGRVPVGPTLQLAGHPEVFVIGDLAHAVDQDGSPLPQLAAVAQQQGKAVARAIKALDRGQPPKPFRYRDKGILATIGRNAAVVQMGRLRIHGFIGWVTWLTVHLILLISFRSRILVLINWAYDYFFYDRPVRLILRADRSTRDDESDEGG